MLTDKAIAALKPRAAPYRVADGQSLFIQVSPSGGLLWRFRYRWQGVAKTLALGVYPKVRGPEARRLAGEARQMLEDGINPVEVKKAEKVKAAAGAENTFRVVALEWQAKVKVKLAENTRTKHEAFLKNDILAVLGDKPIGDVKAADVLAVVKRIEARGAFDVASRAFNIVGRICSYAVSAGYADRNPSRDIEISDILHRPPVKHHAAPLTPDAIGGILRAADSYNGTLQVRIALQMIPHVAVRPGELRAAQWADIDMDSAEWRFHSPKMHVDQIVPLSTQVVAMLRELQRLTGKNKYLFASERTADRPMSENTLTAAYRRMGFAKDEITAHGWRATFRTIGDEVLKERPDLLEAQLGHKVIGPLGRAYSRMEFLEERKALMQRYSDYLDSIK